MITCPKCDREWRHNTEQAISVQVLGYCIACSHLVMSGAQISDIMAEMDNRAAAIPSSAACQDIGWYTA